VPSEINIVIPHLKFPNQYDVIRVESERFNRLSVDRKFEVLEAMIQTGLEFIELSSSKEFERTSREQNELQWQLAHNRIAKIAKR
jgi:hypothetical protein